MKLKYLLSGILILAVATVHAQSGDSTQMRHQRGMHRWDGGDSTHHNFRGPGGFNRDGHDGWAHRGGEGGFGRGERGRDGFAHRGFGDGRGGFGGQHIRYTPEQRKQVIAINKDYRQKSADLYKQDNLTLKQYKAGLVALEKDKKAKLEGLLTPQQKNEIAMQHKRMDENRQVREAAHLTRLKVHLNLSDDQVAKIKAGNESLRGQMKAIHENENLLPQEKMEQMKTLMAKRNETYKSVLTADQYTEFEKMMSHHRGGHGRFQQGAPGSRAI